MVCAVVNNNNLINFLTYRVLVIPLYLQFPLDFFYKANKKDNTDKYIDSFKLFVFSRFTLCYILISLFGLHLEFLNTKVFSMVKSVI